MSTSVWCGGQDYPLTTWCALLNLVVITGEALRNIRILQSPSTFFWGLRLNKPYKNHVVLVLNINEPCESANEEDTTSSSGMTLKKQIYRKCDHMAD